MLLDLIRGDARGNGQAGFASFRPCRSRSLLPTGWWSCTMAKGRAAVSASASADARGKSFKTAYYSADLHKGRAGAAAVRGRGLAWLTAEMRTGRTVRVSSPSG